MVLFHVGKEALMLASCYACGKRIIPPPQFSPKKGEEDCVYLCVYCACELLEKSAWCVAQILRSMPIEDPFAIPLPPRIPKVKEDEEEEDEEEEDD
jgi:hypothetical protein